jgi:hypothetical protein
MKMDAWNTDLRIMFRYDQMCNTNFLRTKYLIKFRINYLKTGFFRNKTSFTRLDFSFENSRLIIRAGLVLAILTFHLLTYLLIRCIVLCCCHNYSTAKQFVSKEEKKRQLYPTSCSFFYCSYIFQVVPCKTQNISFFFFLKNVFFFGTNQVRKYAWNKYIHTQ